MLRGVLERPDVLVLAAGGIIGEAWMSGVLRGISDASGVDFRDCETFVGTSAGSIVAASLAAGREPRAPDRTHQAEEPELTTGGALKVATRMAAAATAPLAETVLATAAGAVARRTVLGRLPEGKRSLRQLRTEVDSWGARFDGRLRVCTLDLASGRRVVFGAPGAPEASVAEAAEASCAVPTVFRPVEIGGRTYVDGGAWSITNLDAAPAGRDTRVLCLSIMGGRPSTNLAGALRAFAAPALAVEVAGLRRRGAKVQVITPDGEMPANLLDPAGAADALRAGHRQGYGVAA
jgi:NTE family protein